MKTIIIQPVEQEDGTLPYPYHIDKDGNVGRQDFWRGRPHKLVGFAKFHDVNEINLRFQDFWKNPKKCMGMYAVLAYKKQLSDGNVTLTTDEEDWATNIQAIESININTHKMGALCTEEN